MSNAPLVSLFADATASFLDRTLDGYKVNAADYGLDVMLQYYVLAHTNDTLEYQFLFASVFMEGLKFNWAKNVSGLHRDTKANGVIRGFRLAPSQRNLSFEELMNRLAAHLGYSATFTFIEDRNMLFHSGQGTALHLGHADPYSVMQEELFVLYDQMEDLLLRILGYRGIVCSRADPDTPLEFPARTPAP
ncbi:hypothetical protein [Sorangium sp. So ce1389]|uniref:hypothetical protein n=1 Tax=Sorangium sp. So ce1389 TaxID=3133336 RepID=UPI003F5EE529